MPPEKNLHRPEGPPDPRLARLEAACAGVFIHPGKVREWVATYGLEHVAANVAHAMRRPREKRAGAIVVSVRENWAGYAPEMREHEQRRRAEIIARQRAADAEDRARRDAEDRARRELAAMLDAWLATASSDDIRRAIAAEVGHLQAERLLRDTPDATDPRRAWLARSYLVQHLQKTLWRQST